ncbi:hypothetical protein DM01DRAFT_1325877 [Hesseltinella vesiculosa]|uniref:Gti1/Pac2 family-domain-containing protein n=1 Tax=Hesseltinella vesiculosa TaxID=101127 RepID=A0A1X2GBK3_9FUNG|nr:hypothetical protein DM01DRAFT_1325877 [Hesseltinella vesiculosa]
MSVVETFHGYIETTQDSLLIMEACRRCLLPKVSRRLQEKERKLVRSGSVFVFDEKDSGIKRWTDGLVWSPSRILGNFLIYRELDKRVPKRKRAVIEPGRSRVRSNSADQSASDRLKERQLVGSLSDAYNFKEDGLIKKTMSLIVDGSPLHLVSYYHPDDVVAQKLRTPSTVAELVNLEISPELLVRQNFRIPPVVEPDQYSQPYYAATHGPSSGFATAAGQLAKSHSTNNSRSMSLPSSEYMHPNTPTSATPLYSRHPSLTGFHHSAYEQQHHRASLDMDRSKPVFDPMYNVSTYTLPSPTSSPNTPLPTSVSSVMPPPNEQPHVATSLPFHPPSSSTFNFDYARPHHSDHHTTHSPTKLHLPTLARPPQSNTSINSLLSNDSPHPDDHASQPIGFSDYYNHGPSSHPAGPPPHHLAPPMNRLYSLDETAMQWI